MDALGNARAAFRAALLRERNGNGLRKSVTEQPVMSKERPRAALRESHRCSPPLTGNYMWRVCQGISARTIKASRKQLLLTCHEIRRRARAASSSALRVPCVLCLSAFSKAIERPIALFIALSLHCRHVINTPRRPNDRWQTNNRWTYAAITRYIRESDLHAGVCLCTRAKPDCSNWTTSDLTDIITRYVYVYVSASVRTCSITTRLHMYHSLAIHKLHIRDENDVYHAYRAYIHMCVCVCVL